MPRKPTLSPTKISAFLACPFKYYWTYNDDRGRWFLRAKSYYSFGTTLHRVLQRFHDSGDVGVATTEQALAAYEESWIDAGFKSPEEMQEAFGEGREILERHIEEVRSQPSDAKVLFVEKQLRMPMGDDFDLIGRIDRVDEYPDGSLEIVDYKSGRQEVSVEEVQTDLAMGIYQLLLKEKFPDRPVRATIVALRSGKSATYAMPDDELEEFRQDIEKIGKQVLWTEWTETRPAPKPSCVHCDFLPLCRQDPEFDWPAGYSFS